MGDKLLVRSYNVGCGDCFYVRIPNNDDHFHILIDCGSKESAKSGILERAIKHLEDNMLPQGESAGKKRLDLIVVTHRHEDHIKGFDPEYFKNIEIKHIWITAALDKSHKQAERSLALHNLVTDTMESLLDSGLSLSFELRELRHLYSIGNKGATEAITELLPNSNGIQPTYVYAGQTSDDFDINIEKTKILVLAPEKDIDHFYLGKEIMDNLRGMQKGAIPFRNVAISNGNLLPENISPQDFRKLQSRLLSNVLSFAVNDSSIQNNVSTVLLIEWRGRRLLFVGDAEWDNSYSEGKKNSSWNVMWAKRREHLENPVDFLKVGHHGSHNSTPWNRHADDTHEVNQILNAILPLPQAGELPKAQCIISTKRKQYDTIPDAQLLVEIGKRVSNTKIYLNEFKEKDPQFDPDSDIYNYSVPKEYSTEPRFREVGEIGWLDQPQPLRTDMESAGRHQPKIFDAVEFIDIDLDPQED